MNGLYRRFIRPVLFAQDAETIHEKTIRVLGWIGRRELACSALESFFGAPSYPTEAFGLKFPNPIGLAAGLDKFAHALPAWEGLGFGFIELGGVTWHSQPGNPPPRLFRAVSQGAIVNRMGFNNPGAEAIAETLSQWRELGRWPRHPVGFNLGKSKITSLEQAPEEYAKLFRALRTFADFFVVNVSSPNTPGLRQLQDKAALNEIFSAIHQAQNERVPLAVAEGSATVAEQQRQAIPILVKVSPDLSLSALDDILELVEPAKISGIVATNTTTTRPDTSEPECRRVYAEQGGLSGKPLRTLSTEIIRHLYRQSRGRLAIIGVGGIFNADDAWEKITAGACLLQLYSGLIYEGPSMVGNIVRGLMARMEEAGYSSLQQAVGAQNRC
jgi:dihydroorotate dehydrogenase